MRHLWLGNLGPRYSDIYAVVSGLVHSGWKALITVHSCERALIRNLYNPSLLIKGWPIFACVYVPDSLENGWLADPKCT